MTSPQRRDGDLAAQVADRLQREHTEEILASGEVSVDNEDPMVREARRSIFSKIEFRWRASDEKILAQIRAGVDVLFKDMYSEMTAIVDRFYAQMRVPEINSETGVVIKDSRGRVIWQKDPRTGGYVEDWGQLTGQDIEEALFSITRLRLNLAPRVNDLLNEAVFAKHIADDSHYDAYTKLVEGTVKDRDAYASQHSRTDKYHAFFRYYLWSHADAFLKELTNFTRVLERVRYWRIDDSGKASS